MDGSYVELPWLSIYTDPILALKLRYWQLIPEKTKILVSRFYLLYLNSLVPFVFSWGWVDDEQKFARGKNSSTKTFHLCWNLVEPFAQTMINTVYAINLDSDISLVLHLTCTTYISKKHLKTVGISLDEKLDFTQK